MYRRYMQKIAVSKGAQAIKSKSIVVCNYLHQVLSDEVVLDKTFIFNQLDDLRLEITKTMKGLS